MHQTEGTGNRNSKLEEMGPKQIERKMLLFTSEIPANRRALFVEMSILLRC